MKHTLKNTRSRASSNGAGAESSTELETHPLHELFVNELKDVYWAEKAILKTMPKVIKKASSHDLIAALEDHFSETEEQVNRLEQVFSLIDVTPKAVKCEGMNGILKEAESFIKDFDEGPQRDACIIAEVQKVEHYEIASYGTLRAFASALGLTEAADLLKESLDEEKAADEKLTELAESEVNVEAV